MGVQEMGVQGGQKALLAGMDNPCPNSASPNAFSVTPTALPTARSRGTGLTGSNQYLSSWSFIAPLYQDPHSLLIFQTNVWL